MKSGANKKSMNIGANKKEDNYLLFYFCITSKVIIKVVPAL